MPAYGLSFGVSPREPFSRIVSLVWQAEDAGFDAVWVIDSQLIMKDAYLTLALCAEQTRRIKLGTGVTNPVTRHPTVIANAFAGLRELSDGRALLGIGAGDSAVFSLGLRPAKLATVEATICAIRALHAGEETEIDGNRIRLSTARGPVPIFLAASQPKMLALAGRLADGVIVMGPSDEAFAGEQLAAVRAAAAAAGRPAGEPFVDLWATVSMSGDRQRTLDDVKSWASAQARWLNQFASLPPSLERFRGELRRADEEYDFQQHLAVRAEHRTAVSDELAAALAITGDASAVADRLGSLLRLQPDRLTLTLLSGGREARLKAFADELLPRLA
ncbi:MAG: LLM class flavin-dependent oxidoreductase [Chloroflexi bacterium]|nr:LLM class flavin-dependent oxidoreductase [Chloroflexota bacterium]